MAVSARDRVLRDWARESLQTRVHRCECGRRFVQVGVRLNWYAEPDPPYGSPVNWCDCGRFLP